MSSTKKPKVLFEFPEQDKPLDELKVGDRVVCLSRGISTLTQIIKITKTQIIVDRGRFNKKTGQLVGGALWDGSHITTAKIAYLRFLRRHAGLRLTRHYSFDKEGLAEKLRDYKVAKAILRILEKEEKSQT